MPGTCPVSAAAIGTREQSRRTPLDGVRGKTAKFDGSCTAPGRKRKEERARGRLARVTRLSVVVALLTISAVIATARPPAAGADQVSSLSAQARSISQELVQEQLEADAYQQQYSVASAQVAADQRAIAATQLLIKSDRQQIAKRTHQVERIAIASYVLNGAVSSTSGASLFAENVSTVQSANEYASITIGNLNEAVEKLHSAQRSVQGTLEVLVRQSDRDRAEQAAQATYLVPIHFHGQPHGDGAGTGHGTAGRGRGPAERRLGAGGRRRGSDSPEGDCPEIGRIGRERAEREERAQRSPQRRPQGPSSFP